MPPKRRRSADGRRGGDDLLGKLRDHLQRLGLRELDEGLEQHLSWAHTEQPEPLVLLERVFGDAALKLRQRRVERRITSSGLKVRKALEGFDWAFQKSLDRAAIETLATFRFLDDHEDILITGKAGTGKSHILQALVVRACEREVQARYTRCVDLIDDLYAGLADHTYAARMKRWARAEWLVIDDVGLGQLRRREDEPTAAHMLFNLLDRRSQRASTAITSNIKLGEWGRYLGDATLAGAILDRLAMTSIRIDIDGPSYRAFLARQRARDRGIDDTAPATTT